VRRIQRFLSAGPIVSTIAALALAACAQPPKPPPPPPEPVYSERVILLPSRDGTPSTLVIERPTGTVVLTTPFESVEGVPGAELRTIVETNAVEQRFGGILDAQPGQPFTYLVFFDTGTTRLTQRSQASLRLITEKIRTFPAPQVAVIGHTDRTGTESLNEVLSMRRALAVREMLMELGIAPGAIEVSGRGEREPLVPTADGVPEERNRRVEMSLR
jgi:outer membrane protein OmpA-like peptidoglycan-associated protein